MCDKLKKVAYWVSILPPVIKAIKGLCTFLHDWYFNTLMEIEQKKMEEDFQDSFQYTKGDKK